MHEQPAAAELLLERVINRELRSGDDVLVIEVGGDPDDPAPSVETPMNFITGSLHIILRLTASWVLNIRRATLSLMITTFSLSARSSALKSRPARIGTPSALKNPGDTVRKLARGSSSPSAFA